MEEIRINKDDIEEIFNPIPGPKGKDGKNGKDGKDGKNGLNGLDGKDGKDGIDGKNGLDGKDGSPDKPEDIKQKLESLEGDDRLDAKAIKNLPKIGEQTIIGGAKLLSSLGDVNLTSPTNGQSLTYNTATGKWVNSTAAGTITGPVSSTDNAIVRWDGTTGTTIQNSNISISDLGVITTTTTNGDLKIEPNGTGGIGFGTGVDLSGTRGVAIGGYSTASGIDSIAIGSGDGISDFGGTASGNYSIAIGNNSSASGLNSLAVSSGNASGKFSIAIGEGVTAYSFREVAIGSYPTAYTPDSTTAWDADDRIFVVGNGATSGARSNALLILKTGETTIQQTTTGNPILRLTTVESNDDITEVAYQNKVTTTDATVTTIATIAIPASTTVMIEAKVTARRTGGTAGTAEDSAGYIISAVYKNVAGTATEVGETSIFSAEDQAGWDCSLSASSGNALLRVTGAADNNISWVVTYRLYSISS